MRSEFLSFLLVVRVAFTLAAARGEEAAPSDYLWLELGPQRLAASGSMEQTIRVCFGFFPVYRRHPGDLTGLTLYLAINPEAAARERKWMKLPYRLTPDSAEASIATPAGNRVALLAQARSGEKRLAACFSFILFGAGSDLPVSEEATPERRNLSVLPLAEFDYWPQTQQEYAFKLFWRDQPLASVIYACDEHLGVERLATNAAGTTMHKPGRDLRLDQQGETAFKHVVYVSISPDEAEAKEVATCTRILHRSRSANRRRAAGIALFLGSFAGACLVARWRRQREKA